LHFLYSKRVIAFIASENDEIVLKIAKLP